MRDSMVEFMLEEWFSRVTAWAEVEVTLAIATMKAVQPSWVGCIVNLDRQRWMKKTS